MTLHPRQEPGEWNQPFQPLYADVLCIHLFPNIRDPLDQGLGTSRFLPSAYCVPFQPGGKGWAVDDASVGCRD